MTDDSPPTSVEACVVGHALLYPENLPIARSDGACADWFRETESREAWSIIEDRKANGHATDAAMVYELSAKKVTGPSLAFWLRWACPTELSFRDALGFLRWRYMNGERRGLWGQGRQANQENDSEAEIRASEGLMASFTPLGVPEGLGDALNGLEKAIREDAIEDIGLKTGWADWDHSLGTLQPGELILVAGRPGNGKSSLIRQLCGRHALDGRRVILVSVEMSVREVGLALAKQLSKVPWKIGAKLPMDQVHAYADEVRRITACRTFTILPNMPVAEMVGTLETAMLAEPKPSLVGIDYIQKIAERGESETTAQAIGRVSGALKKFAQKWKIPVVAAAQINREGQKEGEPNLEHLRDSGDLEQDADRVIFLQPKPSEDRYLSVAVLQKKNRNGPTDSITLTWDRWTTAFANSAP